MTVRILLLCSLLLAGTTAANGQHINLDEYEILSGDSLLSKADFLKNSSRLSPDRVKQLEFRPTIDGRKTIYYLSGAVYATGELSHKQENGLWTYWHENGQKAREGIFVKGRREGIHTYWYPNGNVRGTGRFKNDQYDGKWLMYNEDGTLASEQMYRGGKMPGK